MNLKQIIKSKLFEVEQPQSQGEKNFKALHKAVDHKNLVPGVTDQDHVFNGSTKPYDNKHHTGYKPGEDRAAYDKSLKMDNAETDNGYEISHVGEEFVAEAYIGNHEELKKYAHEHGGIDTEDMLKAAHHMEHGNIEGLKHHLHNMDTDPRDFVLQHIHKGHWNKLGFSGRMHEAIGSMIGKTHKDIQHKASFNHKDVNRMKRDEKKRNASLSTRAASTSAVKTDVHAEEIELIDEMPSTRSIKTAHRDKNKSSEQKNREISRSNMKSYRRPGEASKAELSMMAHKAAGYKEMLAKKGLKESEMLDESKWMEKNLPTGNYNHGEHAEKGDIHHIEVHPEVLKKHGISHQVSHAGEYGSTHHFEHPSHGKVAVYQSDLNKKTGNPIISVRTYGKPGATPVAHKFAKKLEGKTMHVYNESVNENYDDTGEEVSMVRTELKAMIVSAQSLLDNMPSDMHIEPWVQSKIAVAKSMVCGVHDYMLYSDDAGHPADMRQSASPMANPYSMSNEAKELSPKQKKIAAVSGDKNKIDAADFAALRKGKKVEEASLMGKECEDCGTGHYKMSEGKMRCDECGTVAPFSEDVNNVKEAKVIKSHALHMARMNIKSKKPMHTKDHVKMDSPKKMLNMESASPFDGIMSLEEQIKLNQILNNIES
jgi:site-specific DNA-cytosine methylase